MPHKIRIDTLLPDSLHEKLERIFEREGFRTRSEFLRKVIRDWDLEEQK